MHLHASAALAHACANPARPGQSPGLRGAACPGNAAIRGYSVGRHKLADGTRLPTAAGGVACCCVPVSLTPSMHGVFVVEGR